MAETSSGPDGPVAPGGLDITIRIGTGSALTPLAAFDHALLRAGVADLNLIPLSSVIPAGSRVRVDDEPLAARFGDRLYCVLAAGYADHPGVTVWAGLGWVVAADGRGLLVEHTGGSKGSVREQIDLSLAALCKHRGGGYGKAQKVLTSAHCVDRPVCALAVAAYTVVPWGSDA